MGSRLCYSLITALLILAKSAGVNTDHRLSMFSIISLDTLAGCGVKFMMLG